MPTAIAVTSHAAPSPSLHPAPPLSIPPTLRASEHRELLAGRGAQTRASRTQFPGIAIIKGGGRDRGVV